MGANGTKDEKMRKEVIVLHVVHGLVPLQAKRLSEPP